MFEETHDGNNRRFTKEEGKNKPIKNNDYLKSPKDRTSLFIA